jgi:tryptophanyl-tRNA synthetase
MERERRCRSGEMLCGECKTNLVERLNKFLEEHRRKREKAKDEIEKYHIKR